MKKEIIFFTAFIVLGSQLPFLPVFSQAKKSCGDTSHRCNLGGGYRKVKKEDSSDNPFLIWEEEKYYEEDTRIPIRYLDISSILYSKDGSYAVINGRILREGDVINNKEITKIKAEEITLKDFLGKEYVAKMGKIVKESSFLLGLLTGDDEDEDKE